MSLAEFEPVLPENERPHSHALGPIELRLILIPAPLYFLSNITSKVPYFMQSFWVTLVIQ
jgi:hypothetical protein